MRVIQLFEGPDLNDAAQVRDRINLYQKIIDQSHHKGEQENAQRMMDKLKAAAKAAGTDWERSSGGTTGHKSTYDTWEAKQRAERAKARQARQDAEDRQWQGSRRTRENPNHDPKWEMRDKFASNLRMPIADVIEVQEYGNIWVAYFRNVDNPKTFDVAEWNYATKDWLTKHPFPNYTSQPEAKVAFEKAAAKRKKFQDGFDKASDKTKASTGASTGAFKIVFVGHYQDDKSDKIWGWGVKGETIYQFWGGRGHKLSVKTLQNSNTNLNALSKLQQSKEAKGYRKQPAANFEEYIRNVLKTEPKFSD